MNSGVSVTQGQKVRHPGRKTNNKLKREKRKESL